MRIILICTYIMFFVISIGSSILSYKLIDKLPIENTSTEKNENYLSVYLSIPPIVNLILLFLFNSINKGLAFPEKFILFIPVILIMICSRITYKIRIKRLKQRYGNISYNLYENAARANEAIILFLYISLITGLKNLL